MNLLPVALIVVGGVAITGVDYVNQSNKQNLALGALAPGAYVETITGRFDKTRADIAQVRTEKDNAKALSKRQAQPAKSHLPQAHDGWTRRDVTQADLLRFNPGGMGMNGMEQELMAAMAQNPTMFGAVPTKGGVLAYKQKTSWIYERGAEIVLMGATFTPPAKEKGGLSGFQKAAMNMAAHNMGMMSTREGFAVVQGVSFFETRGALQGMGQEQPAYRVFEAGLGSQVKLTVRAEATEASIRALMAQVNYDGLNGMLAQPLADVGSHVPTQPVEQQKALADQQADEMRKADAVTSKAMEADLIDRAEAVSKPFAGLKTPDTPPKTAEAAPSNDKPRRLVLSGSSGCSGGSFCSVKD